MQTSHTSPKLQRRLLTTLGLALLAAALVATAGLPPEEQPKPEAQQPPPAPDVPPELIKMHADQMRHFANAPDFGMLRMGFLPPWTDITLAGVAYKVNRPDLIALETKELAYQSPTSIATLANKASRARLPKRPLTANESRAVLELRQGKEIVQQPDNARIHGLEQRTTAETPVIRVIGAMRATGACAKCHEVPQGTLLGAFSYTLVPADKISPSFPAVLGNVPTRPSP